jgi:hypothetical protein
VYDAEAQDEQRSKVLVITTTNGQRSGQCRRYSRGAERQGERERARAQGEREKFTHGNDTIKDYPHGP